MRAKRYCRLGQRDESGFTLVELLVTMVVIAGCLLGLIAIQVRALEATTLAKQRQQATGLANRTMEEMRALSTSDLQLGLHAGDLAGDANITPTASGGYQFKPSYASTAESLVVKKTTLTSLKPIHPHDTTVAVAGTQYRVRAYVTCVGPLAEQGYWLTVVTSWQSTVTRQKTKTVSVRSQVFAPATASPTGPLTCP